MEYAIENRWVRSENDRILSYVFDLNDENIKIREMMLKFAQENLGPAAREIDRTHAFPTNKINALAVMGYVLGVEAFSRYVASVGGCCCSREFGGGNGYSAEFEIERLYRDARVMRIFEGMSEVQREVIAREVVRG